MDHRRKWDERYRSEKIGGDAPSAFLISLAERLQGPGEALDVAGGAGRNAVWLAGRGYAVTVADFSRVALGQVAERALAAGSRIETCCVDLEQAPFPAGPWQVILSFNFLLRSLYPSFATTLAPGGLLIVSQPTLRNLERRERPPRAFLLDEGELPTLVGALEVLHHHEGWTEEDRHEAHLVARKPLHAAGVHS